MTAEELIKKLRALPPDTPVLVEGYESGYDDIVDLKLQKVVWLHGAEEYDGEYEICDNELQARMQSRIGAHGLLSHIDPDERYSEEVSRDSAIDQASESDNKGGLAKTSAIVLLGHRGHLRSI